MQQSMNALTHLFDSNLTRYRLTLFQNLLPVSLFPLSCSFRVDMLDIAGKFSPFSQGFSVNAGTKNGRCLYPESEEKYKVLQIMNVRVIKREYGYRDLFQKRCYPLCQRRIHGKCGRRIIFWTNAIIVAVKQRGVSFCALRTTPRECPRATAWKGSNNRDNLSWPRGLILDQRKWRAFCEIEPRSLCQS